MGRRARRIPGKPSVSKLHLSPSFLDVREGLVLQPRLALNPILPASASQVLEGREPDLLTNFPFAINDC